ncbi:unnamed protein product [Acanthoscelides obtectus]|uniref:Transposase Helix-turn-helix domain-containing protein n=1 Tax=Acanthoscelides obtectus TaxID=200917 RepID=A0A9P0K9P6_ACAOB|nr:unnamed protein product [Acanthoscelides obtectus]CAK1632323.1 hypothetical protein AOBTE_LOCUS7482 [Acanthoscelides obtectus]
MADFMQLREGKTYRKRRNVSPSQSKRLLRFDSESVDFLCSEFLPENNERRGGALSARTKMEICLRYLGDPGFQSGVAEDYGIHRTTACKTISWVLNKVYQKSDHWIRFPTTVAELNIK